MLHANALPAFVLYLLIRFDVIIPGGRARSLTIRTGLPESRYTSMMRRHTRSYR
jgi:hypothetical protein